MENRTSGGASSVTAFEVMTEAAERNRNATVVLSGSTEETRFMVDERIPTDPYRSNLNEDDFARSSFRDPELQPDPALQEGRSIGSGMIAIFAIAIAVVLGVVFYGLNNSNINQASTAPPAHTAQTNPAAAPGAPNARNNAQPGVTTGSATNQPQTAPNNPGASK